MNKTIRPFRKTFLPFSRPTIGKEEIKEVVDSMKSGWVTTGPKCRIFEESVKNYVGSQSAIAVSSATAGMHLVLLALNIKPGDEIITPSMTWVSTVNMIELLGAKPVFVDIDEETLQINPSLIESKITDKTKAIIPVHFAGQTCDLDRINDIAKKHNLYVIEDAAHALGSEYKGKKIGKDSQIAIFSLHVIKNITTAEGGIIVTNNKDIEEKLKLLRFHGLRKDAWDRYSKKSISEYDTVIPGFKYNFTDIQAAIGIHQIKKLDKFNKKRQQLAEYYKDSFEGNQLLKPLGFAKHDQKHIWHLYIIKLAIEKLNVSRSEFMYSLKENNIGTGLHFLAVHQQEYYKNKYKIPKNELPVTEFVSERIVSLPLYPNLTSGDQKDVVNVISNTLESARK